MLEKESIHIIYVKHAWLVPYIEKLGYKVYNPYRGNTFLLRVIREIWFKFKLPFKWLFYNKCCVTKNKTIVIYESLITKDFLEWLHSNCSNCRYLLLYTNKVTGNVTPDQIAGDWCEKWTCDKDDAKKYGIRVFTGGGYLPQWTVNKDKVEYDVFYIGKDKNRLDKLLKIEKDMKERGINTMFYITWEKSWKRKKDGIHRPFLPYDDVLKYIGKSRAILHLLEGAQAGITLRIQESLIHKIKLITDDVDIVKYDFYNSNNIFILGKDDMNNLKEFLDTPYVDLETDFFKHAFYDEMLEEIIKSGEEIEG